MTGQLRSTLQTHADDLDTWDVDLDSIVRAGDRRMRRRRSVLTGGLAGVLVVAGGIAAFAGHGNRTGPPPADQNAKPLTYAVGSVIHTGDRTIDVGKKVVSLVPTHWGFVFSTPDRRLYREHDGQVRPITTFNGRPSHLSDVSSRLVVSDDGLVTAWWDGQRIQTWPGYRGDMVDAFDKTNSFNAESSWPTHEPPRIQAVSDGHLWFWGGQHSWIAEVRPMTTTAGWKDSNPPGSGTVVDAAGDKVLVHVADGMAVTKANLLPWPIGKQDGWKPGGDLAGVTAQVKHVDSGDLAPDGRHWFTDDHDQFAVFDSATGKRQNLTAPGFAYVAPYQWRDNDTIAAVAWADLSRDPSISLLTCHVSTNACALTAPDVGTYTEVAIPRGAAFGD